MKAKILGNYTSNEIELCRTTYNNAEKVAVEALIDEQIPFSRNSKRIPFFKRDKYHGANKVYVISTHPQQYTKARQTLDHLDDFYLSRLVVSNY